jgi:phosphoribosylaminoimidazolecarboxamide formyltransferase/IMP cyclohydrolase
MLRAAAKNYRDVAVVVDPGDYGPIIEEMSASGGQLGLETRFRLAKKVYRLTHEYDGAITQYLEGIASPQ